MIMKNIVKIGEIISKFTYINSSKNSGCWIHTWLRWIHTYEVMYHVSYIWSHVWINSIKSSMNSLIWRILWVHGWIPKNEFTLIWNHGWIHWSWLDLDSVSNPFQWRNKFYSTKVIRAPTLQSAHCQLLLLLDGKGLYCCYSTRQVLRHKVGGTWRAWWTTLDVTGVEICMGQAFLGHFLWGSTITGTIVTHMCQARTCGWVLAPGPTPSAPNSGSHGVHVKSITLPAQDHHWKNPRKFFYRER